MSEQEPKFGDEMSPRERYIYMMGHLDGYYRLASEMRDEAGYDDHTSVKEYLADMDDDDSLVGRQFQSAREEYREWATSLPTSPEDGGE